MKSVFKNLKKNIGTKDRIIRLVIAFVLLALILLVDNKLLQWLLFLGSIFCIFEAISGWCALYRYLGKNSCVVK